MYRAIIKNIVSLSALKMVDLIIPLIILPYLIITVGEENYGIYAFAYTLIFYFLNVTQYGFSLSAVKKVALIRDDKKKLTDYFNRILSTKLFLTVVTLIIIALLTLIVPKFRDNNLVILFVSLMLIGDCFIPIWYFQGIEKMQFITFANIISKLSYLVFVYLLVHKKSDYIYIGLYQSIGFILSGIISIVYIVKYHKIKLELKGAIAIKESLKEGFSSFLILTIPTLYANTSIFLLGLFTPYQNVTLLEAGTKVSSVFSAFSTIVAKALYPFLNRNKKYKKHMGIVQIVLGVFASVAMYICAPILIKYWLKNNPEIIEQVITVVKILSLTPLLFSIVYAYGINGLLVENRDKLFLKSTSIASALGLIIGVAMIPSGNYITAASIIIISRIILALTTFVFYKKKGNSLMRSFIDKIYKKSPIWLQNLIISFYGLILYRKRYGKEYFVKFKHFINKDYSSYTNELKTQEEKFLSFLDHANKNSPFYKKLYQNIDLAKIKSIKDITKLPIVAKEQLRANVQDIYAISEKEGYAAFTGGTTGKSLKVLFTKEDINTRMAYLDAFKYRLGIENPLKVKKATFSGKSIVYGNPNKIFWRNNYAYNQRLYSTFHLNEENLPHYIKNFNNYRPEVLNGFVSALYEVAKYVKRKNIFIHSPKAIFTTSETLLEEHRAIFKEVFKCNVYDQYASSEGAPFITECLEGNLHYNIDTGIIETDAMNNMIVTSFTTHGTPLIRYNIEDVIHFKEGFCNCGLAHPLVKNIEGRKVDFLYNSKKEKVSLSHLADVIKGNPNSIIKMQFIQNNINTIDLKMVVDKNLFVSKHQEMIVKELKYRFDENMDFNISIVNDIPREKSGKYSLIKNNIKQ